MPTAAKIIENVRNLALAGNYGSASDTSKIVNYLNMAYREVYGAVVKLYPGISQTTESVIITDGVGSLSQAPFIIHSVIDTGNAYKKLYATDVFSEEDAYAPLDREGSPDRFWTNGLLSINTYPLNSTSVRVRFSLNPAVLDSNTAEGDIIIPAAHHDVLVWGTLFLLAYDERDKIVGAELQYTEKRFKDAKDAMFEYIRACFPQKTMRTTTVLG